MNNDTRSLLRAPLVVAAEVLAIALIIAVAIGSFTFYKIRSFDNELSVTGSAKTSVVADSVRWQSSITRTVVEGNLQPGYAEIAKDEEVVKSFLTRNGVKPEEVTISPVFMNQVYKNNDVGPKEYDLVQNITVQSAEVDKITAIAKNAQDIIASGVVFSTESPEYYYSKLSDLRVSLLSDALKDAKNRAISLAGSSGSGVGKLKSASSGVVQVLAPNSVEVADSGQYDTSSIQKDVMVTVHATFVLK